MQIIQVKIEELKPAEYNPRALTEKEAKDLKESILRFGMVEPIVVSGTKSEILPCLIWAIMSAIIILFWAMAMLFKQGRITKSVATALCRI